MNRKLKDNYNIFTFENTSKILNNHAIINRVQMSMSLMQELFSFFSGDLRQRLVKQESSNINENILSSKTKVSTFQFLKILSLIIELIIHIFINMMWVCKQSLKVHLSTHFN
jgi:hypothetical protein